MMARLSLVAARFGLSLICLLCLHPFARPTSIEANFDRIEPGMTAAHVEWLLAGIVGPRVYQPMEFYCSNGDPDDLPPDNRLIREWIDGEKVIFVGFNGDDKVRW